MDLGIALNGLFAGKRQYERDAEQFEQYQQAQRERKAMNDSYDAARARLESMQPEEIDAAEYGLAPEPAMIGGGVADRGFNPYASPSASTAGTTFHSDAAAPVRQRTKLSVDPAAFADMKANAGMQLGLGYGSRNPQAMAASMQDMTRKQNDMMAAQIARHVMSMPPDEAAELAKKITSDKQNLWKIEQGKGGYWNVSHGGEAVPLSPTDMARFVGGMYKLRKSDGTGLNDIAAVNQNLAALVQQSFDQSVKLGTMNNTAAHYVNTDANNAASLGLRQQQMADEKKRQAAGDWKLVGASGDNKGLVQYNQVTGATRVMPLPPGTDATGLFAKLTGERAGGGFTKLPDDGARVAGPDGTIYEYQGGERLVPGAVHPSERQSTLESLVDPTLLEAFSSRAPGALRWAPNGDGVYLAGERTVYQVRNRDDMRALNKKLHDSVVASQRLEEATRDTGKATSAPTGPQNRYGMPGIYPLPMPR